MSYFRNRISEIKSQTIPREGIAIKQMTLLTNPELVSNEELLQLKSDLNKIKFVKFTTTVGIAAVGILYFKSNLAGSIGSVIAGLFIGQNLSSIIRGKDSAIAEVKALQSYKNHRLNISHFNYLSNSTPIHDYIMTEADKHHKVQRSQYI